jgi:tripartite-type tricarboxylate transporter receptor subunit TctC
LSRHSARGKSDVAVATFAARFTIRYQLFNTLRETERRRRPHARSGTELRRNKNEPREKTMAFNAAWRIAAGLLVVTAMMPFAFVGAGQAQDYPTRPIRIIVPTQPGGMSDILSRLYAQKLAERTGATVVVENKTGANGVLAADYVAKSAPDGYTIFLGFQGTQSVMQHLDPKLPYDPVKDFAPVVLLASNPSILAVHPSFPARTVKEFVEAVKAKPGTYSYASAGFGTTHHLAAELFKLAANVDIAGVTYRGAAPANQDVIAGHVPIVFDSIGNAMTNVRAGTVRPLAVTAAQRSPMLPDVPTMAEASYPDVVSAAWFAFFVPAKTPPSIVAWLNQHANEIFATPDIRERFANQGVSLPLGSPAALGAYVEEETLRWGNLVRKAHIQLP